MGKLFAIDGKLINFLNKVADLVLLNLIWLICCIPVVTIGAATTALYYVSLKIAKGEEPYVVRNFFHSFKENFRQSTVVWLMFMATGIVLYFDFYFCSHMQSGVAKALFVPLVLAAFLLSATVSYIFPVLACFKNSTKKVFKNSLRMAIGYLPYTLLILVLSSGPIILLVLSGGQFILAVFADIVIGVSLFAWMNAHIFNKLFQRYLPE